MDFMEAVRNRRSVYAIGHDRPIDRESIRTLVGEAVLHTPSPFNSQAGRVVILFGEESRDFWKIVEKTLEPMVPKEAFGKTVEKLAGFAAGHGTILFFEEEAIVKGLQEKFPGYSEKFPVWSTQSNGMLEFVTWTALEAAGLGASLQHYNPVIDDAVKARWKLPASWKLYAEMPFGSVVSPAGDKEFTPLDGRLKSFG